MYENYFKTWAKNELSGMRISQDLVFMLFGDSQSISLREKVSSSFLSNIRIAMEEI